MGSMNSFFRDIGGQTNSPDNAFQKGTCGRTHAHLLFKGLVIVSMIWAWAEIQTAHAAEGASSNYFPGTYGDVLVAVQPKPSSFQLVNYAGYVSSKIDRAVINNQALVDVNVQQGFVAPLGLYTFKKPVLGDATFSIGGFFSVAAASLQSTLTTPNRSPQSAASNSGFGTSGLIPAYFVWKLSDDFSLATFELIYMPTGGWDSNSPLNLNRGYWSFDTNLALTFFHEKSGTELSVTGGLMANTTNSHTDYWTAPEFHLEYVANQFVTSFLSIGLHGYFYSQVANDHPGPTAAAALNLLNLNTSAVRSQSYGLGPQIN
ncbi:MAG: transporter [Nitrospira sp.]|nr:transporter [Nitrospira sp.]